MTQQVQHINRSVTVGALATITVAGSATNIDAARLQGVRIKKIRGNVSWFGKTTLEGPVMYGLASIDLSNSEIAEALNADPQSENDQPASDRGNRKVVPMGIIPRATEVDGRNMRSFMNITWPWKVIPVGSGLKIWVFNLDTSTLTTGMEVKFNLAIVQEWIR